MGPGRHAVTARTIRDDVLDGWEKVLVAEGADPSSVHAIALKLEQSAVARGARLPDRVRFDDPAADAVHDRPAGTPPIAEFRRERILMRHKLTAAQLDVLEAVDRGEIYRSVTPSIWQDLDGRNVSQEVWPLAERGYLAEAEPNQGGHIFAEVTPEGRELLDELASRGPDPDTKGTRA